MARQGPLRCLFCDIFVSQRSFRSQTKRKNGFDSPFNIFCKQPFRVQDNYKYLRMTNQIPNRHVTQIRLIIFCPPYFVGQLTYQTVSSLGANRVAIPFGQNSHENPTERFS